MGRPPSEDRPQEGRKHIVVSNGAPGFLNLIRKIFQNARYNVTTTNFVPNSLTRLRRCNQMP